MSRAIQVMGADEKFALVHLGKLTLEMEFWVSESEKLSE
jgi:hypothetical protein